MAVAILDSGIGDNVDPNVTVPAGSNRMAYVCMYSDHSANGARAATACTLGGQTTSLIDTVKEDRESIAVAIFRLDETGIAAMSGNAIVPTWGDTDGTPDNPFYGIIYFGGVDQSTPNTTPDSYSNDILQSTWDPGDINGVVDGYILALTHLGGNPATHVFDALVETESLGASGAFGLIGTLITTDTSANDLAVTYNASHRPAVMSAMTLNPAAGVTNTTILVPLGPIR
jgi:hypothetical protein